MSFQSIFTRYKLLRGKPTNHLPVMVVMVICCVQAKHRIICRNTYLKKLYIYICIYLHICINFCKTHVLRSNIKHENAFYQNCICHNTLCTSTKCKRYPNIICVILSVLIISSLLFDILWHVISYAMSFRNLVDL